MDGAIRSGERAGKAAVHGMRCLQTVNYAGASVATASDGRPLHARSGVVNAAIATVDKKNEPLLLA